MRTKSKKRWSWSKKDIRRSQPFKNWGTAPKWYCRIYSKHIDAQSKLAIRKIKLGDDLDFIETYNHRTHRHTAAWDWW